MSGLHLLLVLLLAWPWQTRYPRSPFVPKDTGANDRALMSVRAQTLAALKGRDPVALSALMTPEVRNSSSALLEPSNVSDDVRWGRLEMSLAQGGDFVERGGERRFCMPYAFARYPTAREMSGELDRLTEGDPWVVMGKGVEVHTAPRRDSPVIGTLSNELVELQAQSRPDESGARLVWQWVFLPNGKDGYVLDRYVWSRDREHVCFSKRAGAWRIIELGL